MSLTKKQVQEIYLDKAIKYFPYKIYTPNECCMFLRISRSSFYTTYANKIMTPLRGKGKPGRTYYPEAELINGFRYRFNMNDSQIADLKRRFRHRK